MDEVLVLGQDGRVHKAEVKMRDDLEACTRRVALRRIGDGERLLFADRLCTSCFPMEASDAA
jgi:hypothetical protein